MWSQVYSAVLLLGNLSFQLPEDGEGKAELASVPIPVVTPQADLEAVAALLQIEPSALSSLLVTKRIGTGRGSFYDVPLTTAQCVDMRDALAKAPRIL